MKDAIKLLLLLLPMLKDLAAAIKSESDIGKKKRIMRILKDKELDKLSRLSRILGLTIKDAKVLGYTKVGVIVNESFVMDYYRMKKELGE